MDMTRREFLVGASAFAGFGMFGGSRLLLAAAGAMDGRKPRLVLGVLSDLHIRRAGIGEEATAANNSITFRHALEWFRSEGVDAVVISGDMADWGLDENLMAVSEAWYSVFPDDKYPDGRRVEKVFVTGNHDWGGFNMAGGIGRRLYPDEAEFNRHILQADLSAWWDRAFHEQYTPIYAKEIKGFTFIGSHWHPASRGDDGFGRVGEWIAANGKRLDPSRPFFYVQHPHLKDTCYGPWAWGHDGGAATKALSPFQSAIAISGHSHYSLTDERSVWQGAFTSIGAASLQNTDMPYDEFPPAGYENTTAPGRDAWRCNAVKMMGNLNGHDCRQGMLWKVYDDIMVVKRREFLSGFDLGPDWVIPLGAAEPRPFSFAERAKKMRAPEFPAGATVNVSVVKAKNRGGKARGSAEVVKAVVQDAYKVSVPAIKPEGDARLFSLEFAAFSADGKGKTKLVLAEGFNHSPESRRSQSAQYCIFGKDELGRGDVCFTVTPMNCFGERGKPVTASFQCGTAASQVLGGLRFMSYNIHHCAGADNRIDIPRVASAILRENPDFVGLNEVDCLVQRSGNVDEAKELGRLTGLNATFGEAIPFQGGSYGNAVLSRDKPLSVERIPLPGKEPRVLLLCEFKDFWFGTAHLDFGSHQLSSVEIIRGIVKEKSRMKPVFLAGDWNATPKSETLAAMRDFMTVVSKEDCRTFHGFKNHPPESEYCIDYIAVDSAHAAKVKVKDAHATPDAVASDHNPIAAIVELGR